MEYPRDYEIQLMIQSLVSPLLITRDRELISVLKDKSPSTENKLETFEFTVRHSTVYNTNTGGVIHNSTVNVDDATVTLV